jgi:hypothetical protein
MLLVEALCAVFPSAHEAAVSNTDVLDELFTAKQQNSAVCILDSSRDFDSPSPQDPDLARFYVYINSLSARNSAATDRRRAVSQPNSLHLVQR